MRERNLGIVVYTGTKHLGFHDALHLSYVVRHCNANSGQMMMFFIVLPYSLELMGTPFSGHGHSTDPHEQSKYDLPNQPGYKGVVPRRGMTPPFCQRHSPKGGYIPAPLSNTFTIQEPPQHPDYAEYGR